jgi:hypothetical protein
MHTPLPPRPEEVAMFTRRIVASACALCLLVPAAAGAKPISGPFHGHLHHTAAVVVAGDTSDDLRVQQYEQAISGDTKGALPRAIPPATLAPTAHATASNGSQHDGANGWHIAAVAEGALLAAFALGSAVFLAGRQRRDPRMGM